MPDKAFSSGGGYRWLDVWALANVIQLGTQKFCLKFLKPRIDPCGRMFDQMTQAARSGVANIAEGYSRRATSKESEMRLYDVAKASLDELAGDFRNWLMLAGELPWSESDQSERAVFGTPLDSAAFTEDVERNSAAHVLAQYAKFTRWLDSDDSLVAARAMLVLIGRAELMLVRKIGRTHGDFVEHGGFAENLTRDRLAARNAAAVQSRATGGGNAAPQCPKCGKPMLKRVAKRGKNAGNEFWSCSAYPECHVTRAVK